MEWSGKEPQFLGGQSGVVSSSSTPLKCPSARDRWSSMAYIDCRWPRVLLNGNCECVVTHVQMADRSSHIHGPGIGWRSECTPRYMGMDGGWLLALKNTNIVD